MDRHLWRGLGAFCAVFALAACSGGSDEPSASPADPRAAWEPVWAAKIRVRSVASAMLGMPEMGGIDKSTEYQPARAPKDKKPGAIDILRGVLGR